MLDRRGSVDAESTAEVAQTNQKLIDLRGSKEGESLLKATQTGQKRIDRRRCSDGELIVKGQKMTALRGSREGEIVLKAQTGQKPTTLRGSWEGEILAKAAQTGQNMIDRRGSRDGEITVEDEEPFTKSLIKKKEDAKIIEQDRSLLVGITAIFLYGITSLAQTIFNKKVLATYDFHGSNFLMLVQLTITASVLFLLRTIGLVKFPTPNIATANKILPISICYFVTVLLALVALPVLSLAMYSALKRLVAFMILICELYVLNKKSPTSIWLSVGVMVLGAVVAGISDMTFDLYGYMFALSSCMFQALYLVLVKKNAKDVPPVEMLFYNSALSLPFVFALVVYFDEFHYTINFPLFNDHGFKAYFFLSIFLGSFLNFFIFYCTSVNSPLTTSITGQAKNILTTVLGVLIFNDLVIRPINVIGLVINAFGGLWYTWLKLTAGGGGG